jgi:hypothetical protein
MHPQVPCTPPPNHGLARVVEGNETSAFVNARIQPSSPPPKKRFAIRPAPFSPRVTRSRIKERVWNVD